MLKVEMNCESRDPKKKTVQLKGVMLYKGPVLIYFPGKWEMFEFFHWLINSFLPSRQIQTWFFLHGFPPGSIGQ